MAKYNIKGSGVTLVVKGEKKVVKGLGVTLDEKTGDALVARRQATKVPEPKKAEPEAKKATQQKAAE